MTAVTAPVVGSHPCVRRLDIGYFLRPAEEYGGRAPRAEPVYAYLVRRDEGLILFDAGIAAADPETEAHYRPWRRPLAEALKAAGTRGPRSVRRGRGLRSGRVGGHGGVVLECLHIDN